MDCLPPAKAFELRLVCREWHAFWQLHTRFLSVQLLRPLLGKKVAAAVETALFQGCGSRAGPGFYNSKLRSIALNLRQNAELCSRVASGALPPAAFCRLSAADMLSRTAAEMEERVRAEAAEAARMHARQPHLVGRYTCAACGDKRQYVRRFLRAGQTDVTKASELLICFSCRAEVGR
jgi:hypothetical protein